MKPLLVLAKLITYVNRLLAVAVSVLVFCMVAMIAFDVFCRYFLNSPTLWAMEFSTLLLGPYFMLSGAYVLHISGHVNVDILYESFTPSLKRWVNCFIYLVILLLCLMFTVVSWPIAVDSLTMGETTFSSWNPVIWPIKMVVPIALFLVGLQSFAELIFTFAKQENKIDPSIKPGGSQ